VIKILSKERWDLLNQPLVGIYAVRLSYNKKYLKRDYQVV
jgi:hypothetical protein